MLDDFINVSIYYLIENYKYFHQNEIIFLTDMDGKVRVMILIATAASFGQAHDSK